MVRVEEGGGSSTAQCLEKLLLAAHREGYLELALHQEVLVEAREV